MSGTRWVKPARATYAPRCIVGVAVEGEPIPGTERGGIVDIRWSSGAASVSRFRDGRWSAPTLAVFDSGPDLLDFVEQQSRPKCGTWVVAPLATYALTLAGFWDQLEARGAKWSGRRGSVPEGTTPAPPGRHSAEDDRRSTPCEVTAPASASGTVIVQTLITRGNPDIIRYEIDGRRLTWVSGANYLQAGEDQIAAAIGYQYRTPAVLRPGGASPTHTAPERAQLWCKALCEVADWWRRIDGGPWQPTVGGLSLSYFRKRLAPKTLLSHQEDKARECEEKAVFGGRASTWCYASVGSPPTRTADGERPAPVSSYGIIPGPLEHWDISSMYPTILAREQFPCRLLHCRDQPSVEWVMDQFSDRCVIADVTLNALHAEYPFRDVDRVSYPLGHFRTALAGPELLAAIHAGEVLSFHRVNSYRSGQPFAQAAGELIQLRADSACFQRPAWELFVKTLANAFGGKLAQTKHQWQAQPRIASYYKWGRWVITAPDPKDNRVFEAKAGLVFQQVAAKHKGRPLAACFAYLTAYGRSIMRELRRQLPADRVASQDTDGLWVIRPTPHYWLKVKRVAAALGYRLRRTDGATAGRFFGPRHYWTTKGWVLAGYHDPARVGTGLSFRDLQSHIVPRMSDEGQPTTVQLHTRETRLTLLPADGRIDLSGWCRPRHLAPAAPLPLESAS